MRIDAKQTPLGVAVLGSTGSIGRSTLDVLRRQRDHFRVVALTGGRREEQLAKQVLEWQPAFAGLAAGNGRSRLPTGPAVLVEAATLPEVDIVVNAVVGAAGLDATLAALRAGKRVALANKESLVMAGDLVAQAACAGGGELVPVDSEHSAVLQCVTGQEGSLARLILTCSGGPFREWPAERVRNASVDEALRHPTWAMGNKITVDCATLANKALEVIEAHHLFGLRYDDLEVVIHPQSIVHAFVEFYDGSIIAQLGFPSMELPILYALTHPARLPDGGMRRFDPVAAGPLTFEPARRDVFRALDAGLAAGRAGGVSPAVFNAANEEAVAAFLVGAIPFGRISEVIEGVLDSHIAAAATSLDAVREADRQARVHARKLLSRP
jgi:1-deoxy-D-xylulose-5-phosphate reductoisomerase